ncbi:phospholipase D-like domain-containing protein [Nitrogeniibacter aestuarii]|uniref:phospholipase D-like domain-containing protein n=1 Tax=Nitrogeniibacter aestuarii TaxID=2815343 RepID=UPI001E305907|nr:phospholipase D-like domain-containing protein [Nitrogeniibacter aestuarii]
MGPKTSLLEACDEYVTLLNLRNWEKLCERYVTEQIYVHSKLMVVDDRIALIGSANIDDRSLLGERDSELAVLVIDDTHEKADIGLGRQTPVRKFARELRMDIWKKLFGITGNVRPATHLQAAIEQPVKPASWKAIQKQARENAEAYEKAFEFVPRNWVDEVEGRVPAKILPTWDSSSDVPEGIAANWGKKGYLKSPLPFQSEFWGKPRYNPTAVAGLNDIKGFITALPVHWTEGENIKFVFPTSLVVQNDRTPAGTPLKTAWDATQEDQAITDEHV